MLTLRRASLGVAALWFAVATGKLKSVARDADDDRRYPNGPALHAALAKVFHLCSIPFCVNQASYAVSNSVAVVRACQWYALVARHAPIGCVRALGDWRAVAALGHGYPRPPLKLLDCVSSLLAQALPRLRADGLFVWAALRFLPRRLRRPNGPGVLGWCEER